MLGLHVHQHRTRLSQLQLISHPLTPGGWVGLSTPAQGCLQWTGENGTHYLSVWHSTVRTQHPLRQSSDHTNHLMALPTSAAMPQLQTWWKGLSSVWLLGMIHTETLVTSQIRSNASLKDVSESWARQVHNIKIRPTLSTLSKMFILKNSSFSWILAVTCRHNSNDKVKGSSFVEMQRRVKCLRWELFSQLTCVLFARLEGRPQRQIDDVWPDCWTWSTTDATNCIQQSSLIGSLEDGTSHEQLG